jgi:hypothetical protein
MRAIAEFMRGCIEILTYPRIYAQQTTWPMANLWWYGVWPVVIRESKYLKRHECFHKPPEAVQTRR